MFKCFKYISLVFILLLISLSLNAQSDSLHTIKVHFIYGSKPAKGFKSQEFKYLGGIHGGHVKIETDSLIIGFIPRGKVHIFNHHKNLHGTFYEEDPPPDSLVKVTTFELKITKQQYLHLLEISSSYLNKTPYDYAFFGMRCATATYDLLSHIEIFKERSKFGTIFRYFYPKLLRTDLFQLAEENKEIIITRIQGKKSRKWEKDKKKYRYPYPN